ncbi:hypothetical protein [Herbaspirillum huttiense]|jgi:hypothetical protein|nr:hypothetical protein [Herbaspirillum huttiense]
MSAFGNRVLTGESVLAQQNGGVEEVQSDDLSLAGHWLSAQ